MTKKQAELTLEGLKDLHLKSAERMKTFALAPHRSQNMKEIALVISQTYDDTAFMLKKALQELRDDGELKKKI